MKQLVGFILSSIAVVAGAAPATPEAPRVVQLVDSDPAATKSFDQDVAGGAHLMRYSFNVMGAKGVGLSELEGPLFTIGSPDESAEIFYVYSGTATITQANGRDLPVKKGDIVFVPRGVAYGGKDFVHYKHAYIVFDRGKEPVADSPSAMTLLRPRELTEKDFQTEGAAKRHYYYRGADGSSVRVWEAATSSAESGHQQTLPWSEYSIVVRGSVKLTSGGTSWTAHAGDAFFAPKGTVLSYESHDLRKLTVVSDVQP